MFNPHKPYGKFCPPWRGVAFEQNGRYYTADHDEVDQDGKPLADIIEVENGKSHDYGLPEPEKVKNGNHGIGPLVPIQDLLANSNMPFMAFRKAARGHLGESCPALKADIITALKAKEAAQKPPPPSGAPAPSQASTKETVAPNGVDIVAWVDKRISKQYLMGDVYKAIKDLFHKVVSNERDAINFLIDEGVIEAQYARNAGAGLTWKDIGGKGDEV